jgi:hypothetical protein
MSATEILAQARALGVRVTPKEGGLCVRGPKRALRQLAPILRQHKPEILLALAGANLDPFESSAHWLVIRPAEKIEMYFTPDISRRELAERYPGALLVRVPDSCDPSPAKLHGT